MERILILMMMERRSIGNGRENPRMMGKVVNQSRNLPGNSKLNMIVFFRFCKKLNFSLSAQ